MEDQLKVHVESRNGTCTLRIAGELDCLEADGLPVRVIAAIGPTSGPLVVDLSGLTFIDAAGARALTHLIRTLPADRLTAVSLCTPAVRRVLDILRMPPPAMWVARRPATTDTMDLIRRMRLALNEAIDTQSTASHAMGCLRATCIRVANTCERAGLIREQARETLAGTRATRTQRVHAREGAAD